MRRVRFCMDEQLCGGARSAAAAAPASCRRRVGAADLPRSASVACCASHEL